MYDIMRTSTTARMFLQTPLTWRVIATDAISKTRIVCTGVNMELWFILHVSGAFIQPPPLQSVDHAQNPSVWGALLTRVPPDPY